MRSFIQSDIFLQIPSKSFPALFPDFAAGGATHICIYTMVQRQRSIRAWMPRKETTASSATSKHEGMILCQILSQSRTGYRTLSPRRPRPPGDRAGVSPHKRQGHHHSIRPGHLGEGKLPLIRF